MSHVIRTNVRFGIGVMWAVPNVYLCEELADA